MKNAKVKIKLQAKVSSILAYNTTDNNYVRLSALFYYFSKPTSQRKDA